MKIDGFHSGLFFPPMIFLCCSKFLMRHSPFLSHFHTWKVKFMPTPGRGRIGTTLFYQSRDFQRPQSGTWSFKVVILVPGSGDQKRLFSSPCSDQATLFTVIVFFPVQTKPNSEWTGSRSFVNAFLPSCQRTVSYATSLTGNPHKPVTHRR